jgi:hypothetical protein
MAEGSVTKKILNVAAIVSAVLAIEGGLSWAFKDNIITFIKEVAEEGRPSTRKDLSAEMEVRPELVVIELGRMYKDFKTSQQNIEEFNNTWIPHLEKEKLFFHIGFFFDVEEDKVKFKDFDGSILPCWHDEQGWYYMKEGYKYYG